MVVTLHLISKTPAEVRWHCWARVSCRGMQCSEQTWACAHLWEGERKTLSPKRVSITALDVLSGLTLSWLTCLTLCLQVFFIFTFWLCCICTAARGLLQLWHLGSLIEVYAFGSHLSHTDCEWKGGHTWDVVLSTVTEVKKGTSGQAVQDVLDYP